MFKHIQENWKIILNTSSSVASGSDICLRKHTQMKTDFKTKGGHPLPETT